MDTLSARKATGKEWVVDLFRAIDSMDARTFAEAFAEEGTFRFGNSGPVAGTQKVQQSVSEFFSLTEGSATTSPECGPASGKRAK